MSIGARTHLCYTVRFSSTHSGPEATTMQPTLNIALRAARIASEQIVRDLERLDMIKGEQSSLNEFLQNTAASAEKTVAYTIQKAHPEHQVYGRFLGTIGKGTADSEVEWRVDPIQGESNFLHGLPVFALTLVCRQKGRAEHAVIINPVTGEEFTASRGRGAQLNGRRIRVSPAKDLNRTLITSTYASPGNERPHLDAFLEMFKNISLQGSLLQDNGCAALSLAYIAAGRYDAGVMLNLDSWDLEPGLLLIQEAGGLMGDLMGNNKILDTGNLVTGNPKLFKQLLQTIHPALSTALRR